MRLVSNLADHSAGDDPRFQPHPLEADAESLGQLAAHADPVRSRLDIGLRTSLDCTPILCTDRVSFAHLGPVHPGEFCE